VLLLDEVLAVGDMQFYAKCLNTIGKMRRNGTAFILVSHSMININRYCDRVVYMQHGRAQFTGDVAKGVNLYEQNLGQPSHANNDSGSKLRQAGSGSLRITSVKTRNKNEEAAKRLDTSKAVEILLEYQKTVSEPLAVDIELVVICNGLDIHRFCHAGQFVASGGENSRGSFRCLIPSLPLNAPEAEISITLWRPNFTELYDWVKDIKVSFNQNERSSGLLHLPVSIEHQLVG